MKAEKYHKKRHKVLHECLDELVADYMTHTKELPSKTTIASLMEWSAGQVENPISVGGRW